MKAQKMFGGTKPKETGENRAQTKTHTGSGRDLGNAHSKDLSKVGVPNLGRKHAKSIGRPSNKEDNRTAWR